MTRSNIVFGVLLLMLGGLAFGFAMRRFADGHETAKAPAQLASEQARHKAPKPVDAAAAGRASASATPVAHPTPGPRFERPLSIAAFGWRLAAPGVLQNDGLGVNQQAAFAEERLQVRVSVSESMDQVENALARGGTDDKGADVAIVPLPEFVASYEALKALDPVMFLITSWSSGRDVMLSRLKSLAELPSDGPIVVRGTPGSSELFLTAFVLASTGVDLARVSFEAADTEAPNPHVWALARNKLDSVPDAYHANVLLSSAEALKLIPYVAIAQRSLVEKHTDALTAFARVWFAGQRQVTRDPTTASRRLAKLEGGPEPLGLLGQLGQIAASSMKDNAVSAVAGRGAVNLSTLFDHCWRYWRTLKVLTTPPPELAPVSGQVIAQLVLSGKVESLGPETPVSPSRNGVAAGALDPLLTLDSGKAKRDGSELVQEVGFIAGVFRRSRLRLAVYSQSAYDKQASQHIAEQVRERFGLDQERLVAHQVRPSSLSSYWLEVMPVQ
jgi:hypothetical protein